jgi:hypothetical protein
MKLPSVLLSLLAGSVIVACGSIAPLEDLPCPCVSGYVCCDKVCVEGDTCAAEATYGTAGCDAGESMCSSTSPGVSTGSGGTSPSNGSGSGVSVFYGPDSGTTGFDDGACAGSCDDGGSGFSDDAGGSDSDAWGGTDDGGSGSGVPESAYCVWPSSSSNYDYDCAYESESTVGFFGCGCSGTSGSMSAAAQTELDCMSNGGSIVTVCPSENLIGCCTTFGGDPGSGDPGSTVACSYAPDMQYQLNCVAQGGTWSTTPPH